MKNKKVENFLKERQFIPHPQEKYKMIHFLNDKGGIIIFECDLYYEFILGYLSNGEIQPEFTFSGLDSETLLFRFDKLYLVTVGIFETLIKEGF